MEQNYLITAEPAATVNGFAPLPVPTPSDTDSLVSQALEYFRGGNLQIQQREDPFSSYPIPESYEEQFESFSEVPESSRPLEISSSLQGPSVEHDGPSNQVDLEGGHSSYPSSISRNSDSIQGLFVMDHDEKIPISNINHDFSEQSDVQIPGEIRDTGVLHSPQDSNVSTVRPSLSPSASQNISRTLISTVVQTIQQSRAEQAYQAPKEVSDIFKGKTSLQALELTLEYVFRSSGGAEVVAKHFNTLLLEVDRRRWGHGSPDEFEAAYTMALHKGNARFWDQMNSDNSKLLFTRLRNYLRHIYRLKRTSFSENVLRGMLKMPITYTDLQIYKLNLVLKMYCALPNEKIAGLAKQILEKPKKPPRRTNTSDNVSTPDRLPRPIQSFVSSNGVSRSSKILPNQSHKKNGPSQGVMSISILPNQDREATFMSFSVTSKTTGGIVSTPVTSTGSGIFESLQKHKKPAASVSTTDKQVTAIFPPLPHGNIGSSLHVTTPASYTEVISISEDEDEAEDEADKDPSSSNNSQSSTPVISESTEESIFAGDSEEDNDGQNDMSAPLRNQSPIEVHTQASNRKRQLHETSSIGIKRKIPRSEGTNVPTGPRSAPLFSMGHYLGHPETFIDEALDTAALNCSENTKRVNAYVDTAMPVSMLSSSTTVADDDMGPLPSVQREKKDSRMLRWRDSKLVEIYELGSTGMEVSATKSLAEAKAMERSEAIRALEIPEIAETIASEAAFIEPPLWDTSVLTVNVMRLGLKRGGKFQPLSPEAEYQRMREKHALIAFYAAEEEIDWTPSEPSLEELKVKPVEPKVIPLGQDVYELQYDLLYGEPDHKKMILDNFSAYSSKKLENSSKKIENSSSKQLEVFSKQPEASFTEQEISSEEHELSSKQHAVSHKTPGVSSTGYIPRRAISEPQYPSGHFLIPSSSGVVQRNHTNLFVMKEQKITSTPCTSSGIISDHQAGSVPTSSGMILQQQYQRDLTNMEQSDPSYCNTLPIPTNSGVILQKNQGVNANLPDKQDNNAPPNVPSPSPEPSTSQFFSFGKGKEAVSNFAATSSIDKNICLRSASASVSEGNLASDRSVSRLLSPAVSSSSAATISPEFESLKARCQLPKGIGISSSSLEPVGSNSSMMIPNMPGSFSFMGASALDDQDIDIGQEPFVQPVSPSKCLSQKPDKLYQNPNSNRSSHPVKVAGDKETIKPLSKRIATGGPPKRPSSLSRPSKDKSLEYSRRYRDENYQLRPSGDYRYGFEGAGFHSRNLHQGRSRSPVNARGRRHNMATKVNVRCRFYPKCKKGDDCEFIHGQN